MTRLIDPVRVKVRETVWIIYLTTPDGDKGRPIVVAASTARQAIMKAEQELEFAYPLPVHSMERLSSIGYVVVDKSGKLCERDVCGGDKGEL